MNEINPQFIKTETGELVVLTRSEFDMLMAAAVDLSEDRDDAAIFDARMADLRDGAARSLPPTVTELMLQGDSLLKALRKWRSLTQSRLAEATGLSQGHLSDLEGGRKAATPDVAGRIARILDVDASWLVASK